MARGDISFASFNLLNLQLPGRAVYQDTDGWDAAVYSRKIDWSARTLQRIAADVIGFQELWAAEALQEVLAAAALDDSHQALTPPGHPGDRIVCAAAVRREMLVADPEWITDFPPELILHSTGDDPQQSEIEVKLSSFSRPVMHLQVQPHRRTPTVHVFVCHFKSRRPTDVWRERGWYDRDIHGPHRQALGYALSTIRRTAEATALRVLITRLTKGTATPVVVIGDINDGQHSNTMNVLTEQPQYLGPLSRGGGDISLYTVQTLQEYRSLRDVYYTHVYKKQRESLDHILISEQFYDNSRDRLWALEEMTVENDHLNFDDHRSTGTNDHGIVRAAFRWRPEQDAPRA